MIAAMKITRLACLGMVSTLAGCHGGLFEPRGPVSGNEMFILVDASLVMLAIGIPTILATIAFAWWFRASNARATYRPGFTYSGRVELVVWSIPLMVILLLGGVSWIGCYQLDPARPIQSSTAPLEVEVVSLDWKWLFIYPDQGIASVNMLIVPAGTPIHFKLTSASVLSAFFVPQLGSMIYTMNGMTTQLNLLADRPGVFRGLSSHYNGDGFSGMHFTLSAVSPEQFTAWVARTRETGPALDAASYARLSQQSLDVTPFTFRSAEPGLFRDIVMQTLPPGPGPLQTRNSVISPRIGGDDAPR
jgi:cytochrome o ubiquinol oxidase subunit 2